MKQLIMTLALLMTAAGAWASEKPIGLNVEYAVGDKITSTSDVYINIWWDNNDDRYGIMVTSTHSLTIESIRPTGIKLIESSNVLDLKNNGAQALYENSTWLTENIFYPSIAASAPTKVHVASGSGTLGDPYVFEPGASGPAVSQVAGKSDEWEMTMPGANVLLNVEWKDATAMALTFNGAEIPTEGVTAYIGYEDEFIQKLTAAVTNSDKNDAAVTTTADDLACESKNQNVIEFQTTPNTSSNSGTLPYIKFLKEGTVQLTVNYRGNVDLSKSATQTIRVNVKEKTYTVDLAANTPDAAGWTGKVGTESTATFTALPVEAKANQQVTLKYDGRRKVKSVTATKVNPMSAATAGDIGKVIGADGYIYANAAAAAEASTTAVAMIAYVGSESNCAHGLAIALEDVSSNDMSYDDTGENNNGKTAEEWCIDWGTSKPVAGAAWRLPSAYDWQRMFIACGSTSTFVEALTGDNYEMYFNSDGFTSKLSAAGGTAMKKYGYWSSTKYNSDAWIYDNHSSLISIWSKDRGSKVRAVLAF